MMGRPYEEFIIEQLRESPGFAAELLKLAIKENTPEELAIIMRQITAAGYDVSVTPKAKPRAARARVGAATKTSRGQKKAKTTKSAPRRSRLRTAAAAAIA